MNLISRRAVLGGLAAIPATAASGSALTPSEAPTVCPTPPNAPGGLPWPDEVAVARRIHELCWEVAHLLARYDHGRWLAEIYPASATPYAVAIKRRDRIMRHAGLYEVRYRSGARIVIAEPIATPADGVIRGVRVSFSIDEHTAGGGYRQSLARFERRMIRYVGTAGDGIAIAGAPDLAIRAQAKGIAEAMRRLHGGEWRSEIIPCRS